MNTLDAQIAEIVARTTGADAVAARRFLAVDQARGRDEAMRTRSAARIIGRFDLGRCIGGVARAIVAAHTPERPYDRQYNASRTRILAQWRAGQMTDRDVRGRLEAIEDLCEERRAEWLRREAREARADYRAHDHAGRVAARLRFRASRPRT